MSRVRLLDSVELHSGVVSLRKDRFSLNGRIVEKEVVEHQPSVGIVPIVDDKFVLLVTQYRRAAEKTLLEIPAGKIEKGETAAKAAAREMAEEIGYTGTLKPLMGWYLAPGYDTEFMRVFVATGLRKIKRGQLDDDEDIAVRKLSLDSSLRKCFNGEIRDCKTVAALLAYRHTLQSGS
ncbi:MAG TPA: NUDIX hydrolase [Nitrososphaera sp.]|nr:NUDIX hydrolase [Nitrososphaera sp.]